MIQKRKIDELISHFNRKVADMDIDMEYKMELLGMITAIGIAYEKELSIVPERAALHDILQDVIDDGIITDVQAVKIMDHKGGQMIAFFIGLLIGGGVGWLMGAVMIIDKYD